MSSKSIQIFPDPPSVYKKYDNPDSAPTPPLPPPGNEFTCFQRKRKLSEPDLPLETYGIERLYKINNEDDYTKEFRRMNQELRECVLKILNALGNKESTRDVILRSKSILINMHHLLNEYRPIQAKKLILMRLKEQIKANEVALKDMADVIVLAKEKLRNK